ncbi:MAG TPA: hypothetical protein VMW53_01600 [archaeon]|nr:hypothetical protein [archaeon]
MSEILLFQWYLNGEPWGMDLAVEMGIWDLLKEINSFVPGSKMPCAFEMSDPKCYWSPTGSISIYEPFDPKWKEILGVENQGTMAVYSAFQRGLEAVSLKYPETEFFMYDLDGWHLYMYRWINGVYDTANVDVLSWIDRREFDSICEEGDKSEYDLS